MTDSEYDEIIRTQEELIKEMEFQVTENDQKKKIAENYDKDRLRDKMELAFSLFSSITMAFVAIVLIIIVIKIL